MRVVGSSSNNALTPAHSHVPVLIQRPEGLVAQWSGEGNANDTVGRNHGTLEGGATFAPGKVGQAFRFDGSNDVIEVPNFGSFTTFSVDGWVLRSGGTAARESILSYKEGDDPNCGFVLSLNEDGSSHRARLWVKVNGSWRFAESGSTLPFNTGSFVAGTYDGQVIRVYIDGLVTPETLAPGSMTQCNQKTGIGGSLNVHHFPGVIDELSIYDRALSAADMKAIFDTDSGG